MALSDLAKYSMTRAAFLRKLSFLFLLPCAVRLRGSNMHCCRNITHDRCVCDASTFESVTCCFDRTDEGRNCGNSAESETCRTCDRTKGEDGRRGRKLAYQSSDRQHEQRAADDKTLIVATVATRCSTNPNTAATIAHRAACTSSRFGHNTNVSGLGRRLFIGTLRLRGKLYKRTVLH